MDIKTLQVEVKEAAKARGLSVKKACEDIDISTGTFYAKTWGDDTVAAVKNWLLGAPKADKGEDPDDPTPPADDGGNDQSDDHDEIEPVENPAGDPEWNEPDPLPSADWQKPQVLRARVTRDFALMYGVPGKRYDFAEGQIIDESVFENLEEMVECGLHPLEYVE